MDCLHGPSVFVSDLQTSISSTFVQSQLSPDFFIVLMRTDGSSPGVERPSSDSISA